MGSSTGLSSFWVIFSITLFGGILGIFGMIIGVPIFAVIFASIKSVVELPAETATYLRLLYINPEDYEFVHFSEEDVKPFSQITQIRIKLQDKSVKTDKQNKDKSNKSQ